MALVIISRLKVDIASQARQGHIHVSGTEIAPIRKVGEGRWEIEIRAVDENGFWYETIIVETTQTEVVEILEEDSE